jgi:hypothetical protein
VVKQINPALARLWQDHNLRRYGVDSPKLIQVRSEAEHRTLDLLEAGLTNAEFDNLHKIAGIRPNELNSLIDRLGSTLVGTRSFSPEFEPQEVERRFSEIVRLFAMGSSDPTEQIARRKDSKVFLSTLNRTGLIAARALYTAGVGQLLTFDAKRVQRADTAELGYPPSALGNPRYLMLLEQMQKPRSSLQLHSRVTQTLERVSAALIISNDVIEPSSYQPWMTRDIPHVSVCFTESGVEVSQLVTPGRSPCLACNEIQRFDSDPNRLLVATQLASFDRDFADAATLLLSIGVAVARLLTAIDGTALDPEANQQLKFIRESQRFEAISASETNCGCRR